MGLREANEDSRLSKEEFNNLHHDMLLLQNRFSGVMREKGEALERIDDLEHVNLQLQNENYTIGKYITWYHNHRKALQQRHHEKDNYISIMAQERETMIEKVEKLEQLLAKVLSAKQTEEIKLEATPATNNGTVVTENDVVATDGTPYDAESTSNEKEAGKMSSAATTTESTSVQQRPDLLPPDKSVSQWQTAPGKLHKFTDLNQRPAETGED